MEEKFLLQAYNTECKKLVTPKCYILHVQRILECLNYVQNRTHIIQRIALHLDQNSYTGQHSYYMNSVFRNEEFLENSCVHVMLGDEKTYYPECFLNPYLSKNMKHRLEKQLQSDYQKIVKKFESTDIDPVYFLPYCTEEIVTIQEEDDGLVREMIFSLRELLYDMFILKKNHKNGKQFTQEFYDTIRKTYPAEWNMYYYVSTIPEITLS